MKTNRNLSRFWRTVGEIPRMVLYAVERKRKLQRFIAFFSISQHRIRLSAEYSRLGEPEPPFEQKTEFSILMQVKVRTSKCRPNGLQQRVKLVVKP